MIKKIPFYAFAFLFFCSCGSYKNVPYFQELDTTHSTEEQITNYSPLIIQSGDILDINVNSRNPESSSIFNKIVTQSNAAVAATSQDGPNSGYIVNDEGFIHLPIIGQYKAAGLSTSALRQQLNERMVSLYKDPVVNVKILNFKVSVFGDVLKPNVYTLNSERTTITQAITLAGDLNITGMRKRIFLIREEGGTRKYIPIDLTSKKIFQSPYFYLKNNDEIYVQPDKTKYATVDRGYRTATLVLSGLSIIAIVLSNIYR